jgi:catabolite regulation protein CreA
LDAYVKDTKCYVCRANTSGIFNAAPEIVADQRKRTASGRDKRAELEEADQINKQMQKERTFQQGQGIP